MPWMLQEGQQRQQQHTRSVGDGSHRHDANAHQSAADQSSRQQHHEPDLSMHAPEHPRHPESVRAQRPAAPLKAAPDAQEAARTSEQAHQRQQGHPQGHQHSAASQSGPSAAASQQLPGQLQLQQRMQGVTDGHRLDAGAPLDHARDVLAARVTLLEGRVRFLEGENESLP